MVINDDAVEKQLAEKYVSLAKLTEEEKAMFLGKNAEIFYGFKDLVELPYIKNMSE